jgi:hypothetical protein
MEPKLAYYHVQKSPQLTPSWASLIQYASSHPRSLRFIFMLSTHLRLGFRFYD